MTMLVRITNEDKERTARVEVQEFEIGKPTPKDSSITDLGPGEGAGFYIHASKRIIIEERRY